MAIKSVFFDLDGTLWDLRACSEYVMGLAETRLNATCNRYEPPEDRHNMLNVALLDVVLEDGLRGLSQASYLPRFRKFLARCGVTGDVPARELDSHCQTARRLSMRAFLKDDAHETLMRLKNRGITTGLLTNGTPAVKRNIIQSLGLRDALDHIVLGEAEGFLKPDKRLFLRCTELAGTVPEETLFVGDNFFTDLLGAKRAGAGAVLLCEKKVKIPSRIPPPDYALKKLTGVLKIV